jgi:hypothetical protein
LFRFYRFRSYWIHKQTKSYHLISGLQCTEEQLAFVEGHRLRQMLRGVNAIGASEPVAPLAAAASSWGTWRGPWENHGKTMGKHGKTRGKWENPWIMCENPGKSLF